MGGEMHRVCSRHCAFAKRGIPGRLDRGLVTTFYVRSGKPVMGFKEKSLAFELTPISWTVETGG
jgi:hypothetical protein